MIKRWLHIMVICQLGLSLLVPTVFAGVGTPDWAYPVEPGNWVNSVSVSDTGKAVLAGSCNLISTTPANYGVYCLDYTGHLKWKDSLNQTYRGVFWTAISKNGAYGAVGGLYSQSPYHGFVRAYNMATGAIVLDEHATEQRVNVVALSQDGTWLIACDGGQYSAHSTLRLYKLTFANNTWSYVLKDSFDAGAQSIGTAAISQDGAWIVIGSGGSSGGSGVVRLFNVANDHLVLTKQWQAPAGASYVQVVDMSEDGAWFGVALPNHAIYLFKRQDFATSGTYSWTAALVHNCGGHNVYALRLLLSGLGVVTGSNCQADSDGGWIDMYRNPPQLDSQNKPKADWSYHTDRPPNAGMGIDGSAKYVVAADGHPLNTLSYFYLFSVGTGDEAWKYQSGNMNWGAAVSYNGDAVVGGSDDGKIYFWNNKKSSGFTPFDPHKIYKPKIPWWEWPMDRNIDQRINREEQYIR